jgi:hypothetical protein
VSLSISISFFLSRLLSSISPHMLRIPTVTCHTGNCALAHAVGGSH